MPNGSELSQQYHYEHKNSMFDKLLFHRLTKLAAY